ncbi:hypothetical protein SEA_WEASELS2_157 [Rhodococcus phage Weasels2]|uniref:Uncharacterized protein n=1 Tax=Rhodococcus phage Weasels2 TaxID=1897437 RepID=A0A1I9SAD1_9CAUD|nr:hypothetical protein FDH04_gp257 [Rhodococcus phage Weasels2]AOZ63737.1 hypothetical protein SEA_WEASELS2_157 [Rhodococcus phage Weasels2]
MVLAVTRYIVESNGLYGDDLVELIELGLASKMNISRETVQGLMWSCCYISAGEFEGITIKYYEKDKVYVADDGCMLYYGSGLTEQDALQDFINERRQRTKDDNVSS